jgi:hypothetical protein
MSRNLEPIVERAIITMQTMLPAEIAAQNTTAIATVPDLPVPAPEHFFFCGKFNLAEFPAVEVSATDTTASGYDESLCITPKSDEFVTVIVGGWVRHIDYHTLMRHCYRMGAALSTVLTANDAAGAGSRPVSLAASYNPLEPENREGSQFTAAAVVVVRYKLSM